MNLLVILLIRRGLRRLDHTFPGGGYGYAGAGLLVVVILLVLLLRGGL